MPNFNHFLSLSFKSPFIGKELEKFENEITFNYKEVFLPEETQMQTQEHQRPYLSPSVWSYYYELLNEIHGKNETENQIPEKMDVLNEFCFPFHSLVATSIEEEEEKKKEKHKEKAEFLELWELMKNIHLLESLHQYQDNNKSCVFIGKHAKSACKSFQRIRKTRSSSDTYSMKSEFCFEKNNPFPFQMEKDQVTFPSVTSLLSMTPCIDFLWVEISEPKDWVPTLFLLYECLIPNGKSCAVLKLPKNNFDKVTVQMLYICSLLFEKNFLVKPAISNFLSLDKYLILGKGEKKTQLPKHFFLSTENIVRLMQLEVPYLYISKITEINVIITKPVLEVLNEFLQYLHEKKQWSKEETVHDTATATTATATVISFSGKDYKWNERMKFHHQLSLQWREKFHFA